MKLEQKKEKKQFSKNFPSILYFDPFFCFSFAFKFYDDAQEYFLYFSFPQSLLVDFLFFYSFPLPLIFYCQLFQFPPIQLKPLFTHPQIMVVFPLLSLCCFCFHRIFFILTAIKIIIKKKKKNTKLSFIFNENRKKNLHCKKKMIGKSRLLNTTKQQPCL